MTFKPSDVADPRSGTMEENIFEESGSPKRLETLRTIFDNPPYGKDMEWTGYTVCDAASLLLRYLLQLPEPVIPADFGDRFCSPLKGPHIQAVEEHKTQIPSVSDFDIDAVTREYRKLVNELSPLNRHLLLYLLDVLAVFISFQKQHRLTMSKLTALFQPGILGNESPSTAEDCRLRQDVLVFLIYHRDSFLVEIESTETSWRDRLSGYVSEAAKVLVYLEE